MSAPSPLSTRSCSSTGKRSGKSSLASLLVRRWPVVGHVQLIALDSLYPGWDGLEGGVERALEWILRPHGRGYLGTWRRWDWEAQAEAESHAVDPALGVIVEGSGIPGVDRRPRRRQNLGGVRGGVAQGARAGPRRRHLPPALGPLGCAGASAPGAGRSPLARHPSRRGSLAPSIGVIRRLYENFQAVAEPVVHIVTTVGSGLFVGGDPQASRDHESNGGERAEPGVEVCSGDREFARQEGLRFLETVTTLGSSRSAVRIRRASLSRRSRRSSRVLSAKPAAEEGSSG